MEFLLRFSPPVTSLPLIGYGLTLTGVRSEILGWSLVGSGAMILVLTMAPNIMEMVNWMRQRMDRERLPTWNITIATGAAQVPHRARGGHRPVVDMGILESGRRRAGRNLSGVPSLCHSHHVGSQTTQSPKPMTFRGTIVTVSVH